MSNKASLQTYRIDAISLAGVVGFEPTQCWSQSPMPYRLATPHHRKSELINGVIEGGRTLDLQSHNLAFSQLNYDHHNGAPRRIRTFDLCLRRALLYPAELWKQMEQVKGIGPSQPAWKASVLPLNYTCKRFLSLTPNKTKVKKNLKKNKK